MLLTGTAPSVTLYSPAWPQTAFPRGEAPGTCNPLWYGPPRSLADQIFHGEPCLYWGELIQCQSDHGDCVCSHGGVAMSYSEGIDSSTRVHVCQERLGTCGLVLPSLALNGFATPGPQLLGHSLDT
jgi:hypothetical protein